MASAASALDGIFQGLGYTVILVIMCGFASSLATAPSAAASSTAATASASIPEGIPALGMVLPVGGFLTLAVVIAAMQYFLNKPKKGSDKKEEVAK